MNKAKVKILFFVVSAAPTPDEFAAAQYFESSFVATVHFRNASAVQPSDSLEDCHGVAALENSTIPENYAERFPSAENAIRDYLDEHRKKLAEHGEVEAPKPVAQKETKESKATKEAKPVWNAPPPAQKETKEE